MSKNFKSEYLQDESDPICDYKKIKIGKLTKSIDQNLNSLVTLGHKCYDKNS